MPSGIYKRTEKHRKAIGNSLKGKKRLAFSLEWRENMSKAKKGKYLSELHRQNISQSLSGREFSIKHIKNLRFSKLGDKNPMKRLVNKNINRLAQLKTRSEHPEMNERSRRIMLNNIATGKMPQTNTLPHRLLREAMKKEGLWDKYEFRDEVTIGFHSADIASEKLKLAIPVLGNYWHAHPEDWPSGPIDKTQKVNCAHDKSFNTYCKNHKWLVLSFWECDIKSNVDLCISKIKDYIAVGEILC